ncbi:hypothetical protein KCU81_g8262, partial [Aureobasidium melanogenum]|uniref:Uncharacterized protein n=1 Tax=Aureobasidium melanogenum (strain CBS 110374) TaxID=1043003 RepID=A0A074VWV6_AURM1
MTAPLSQSSKNDITAERIACHLNSEPNLPGAEDLDVDLMTKWIIALKPGLRSKEIKRLAPKVLDELRAMDGLTAEDAARHQQRHTIKRDEPVLVYTWGSGGAQEVKLETSPGSKKTSDHQRSACEVVGKKRIAKQDEKEALEDMEDDEKAGGVKLNDMSNEADGEQATVDAAAAKKKAAKKAAKKARKLARNLENAKPPMGKKEEDSEDDGNDSDWTQTSWAPSWASDSERDEK